MLAAGYHGYREGNFLSILTPITNVIDRHFSSFGHSGGRVLVDNIDSAELKEKISSVIKGAVDELALGNPWFDKSGNPDMIAAIPILRKLWPGCAFVFAKRRGIENIISRMRKFPTHSFEFHCVDWSKNMAAWRQMRETLPESARIEIDQQNILQFPEPTGNQLGKFLGIENAKVVKIVAAFRGNRPQQSTAGSADKLHAFTSTGWTEKQKEVFLARCSTEMTAYGYSFDESYFISQPAA